MKKRIIIVEDEAIVAMDVKRMLIDLGYDIPAVTSSGEDAIKKTDEIRPDLVLMDIMIDGIMDGVGAAGRIREEFNIPVVYATAFGNTETLGRAMITAPFGYILKPFGERELHTTIEMALYNHKIENELHESEEFVSSIINNSPNPILVIDLDTSVRYLNPALERLTGFSGAKLLGGKAPYPWLTEESRENFNLRLNESVKRKEIYRCEETYVKENGELFWVEVTATPIISDGNLRYHLINWVDITERKEVEKQLAYMATHDQLTGLPNRALFSNRMMLELAHGQRNKTGLAVMMLDLDKFKEVNDTMGHKVGDLLLQAVGERLEGFLRKSDTIARMGGDEFLVLLPEISQKGDMSEVASKIVKEFRRPFLIDDCKINITASIGVAFYPDNGEDVETLMKNSDIAMYHAKKEGRNNFQNYNPTMSIDVLR